MSNELQINLIKRKIGTLLATAGIMQLREAISEFTTIETGHGKIFEAIKKIGLQINYSSLDLRYNYTSWENWQKIIEAMIGEIDIQGYPGSAEFSMAVKSAKRLLLMDPNDIEAKQFLALAFAFLPSLNEPYEEYNLELPNNLNNPSNQLYLKVIAIFQTPSGSVQDEKFVELIEWLQELLKDDPQAMETSDESNVRVIYYL